MSDADPHATDAWDGEIRARLEDVQAGRVTPVPGADALRQIEADRSGIIGAPPEGPQ